MKKAHNQMKRPHNRLKRAHNQIDTRFSVYSIAWFESYLSNRRFQVSIKNKCSNVVNIN